MRDLGGLADDALDLLLVRLRDLLPILWAHQHRRVPEAAIAITSQLGFRVQGSGFKRT